jgi:hypothetical protein
MGGVVAAPSPHRLVVLSAIQERVAALLANLPEAEGFTLPGGAALIVPTRVAP